MKLLVATLLLLALLSAALGELVHFHDHSVLRFNITNADQMKVIYDLGLDVWSRDSTLVIGMNDIMVSAAQQRELAKHNIFHKEVMIADVERSLSEERATTSRLLSQPLASWFDSYHELSDIYAYYANLTNNSPNAKFIPSIGTSIEGRDIAAVILGSPTATKRIYFQGGQHSREWVSHSTTAYITTQLLTDPTAKDLVDNILFVIVPVVNVDGYVFTWETNRLWRKNRRANTGGSFGVDLNRNWDDHFGGDGSSNNPASDTYHGTGPFSEPETKTVSDFFLQNGPFSGSIDYHSYSQLILRPYGWTTAPPPNDADQKAVGDGIRDAIRATTNVQYTSEPAWELYFTAGTAREWWNSVGKSPISYTIELRDTGTYGFQLPAAQIIPTGQENWAGFKSFANWILSH